MDFGIYSRKKWLKITLGKCGKLSEQATICTFSTPSFGVKNVYNYGLLAMWSQIPTHFFLSNSVIKIFILHLHNEKDKCVRIGHKFLRDWTNLDGVHSDNKIQAGFLCGPSTLSYTHPPPLLWGEAIAMNETEAVFLNFMEPRNRFQGPMYGGPVR